MKVNADIIQHMLKYQQEICTRKYIRISREIKKNNKNGKKLVEFSHKSMYNSSIPSGRCTKNLTDHVLIDT